MISVQYEFYINKITIFDTTNALEWDGLKKKKNYCTPSDNWEKGFKIQIITQDPRIVCIL